MPTSKAIEIDPKNVRAYINRGGFRGQQGDHASAIADDTKAIEIDPKFATAYSIRGENYARSGDDERAVADASKAIEIDLKNAGAYAARGESAMPTACARLSTSRMETIIGRSPTTRS